MLIASENLRPKDQSSRLPHDIIWAKMEFWNQNSIQIYQAGTSINVKTFLTIWGPKVKSRDHHMTKYGQNYSFIIHNSIQMYQVATFFNQKDLITCISENLKFKDKGHHMTKYGQKYRLGSIFPFKCTGKNCTSWH